MIDRLRLSNVAKNQLSSIKRRTGIEHYNAICRHALCLSLANPSVPPVENFNFNGGVEIDWKTFSGGNEVLYYNIIIVRLLMDCEDTSIDNVRQALLRHVHRGLSYLASKVEGDLSMALSEDIIGMLKNNNLLIEFPN
ncbi:DNA sulfur modification protein DndE [Janthinobacterium sp.]|uniref:DNA sulfur modification protein DndE n=1 Tax=Janthinobacterium sp. TaxID=1871054 RepID=UPI002632FF9D|nr:DNA sulfur modification protein DndE [Janthinobacterium sp.]